ncbi:DNA/RNA non-specific endonuclease [Streptococcus suis]|uniref:DNA/RNA non-specific endonuclease n=1 Tax=Streptococcus suis TaxID=1307 RepID=UPI000CF63936|nr:DNA/RNA non-specific endonuclease [Streptococcus suis]
MEKSLRFDSLETNRLDTFGHNIEDKLRNLHKEFPSNVKASDGVYGIQEIQKENGLVERIGRNNQNIVYKEYLRDGQLYLRREKIKPGLLKHSYIDDSGQVYLDEWRSKNSDGTWQRNQRVRPNIEIKKGNVTAVSDNQGRITSASIEDLQLKTGEKRSSLQGIKREDHYRVNDQKGHLIPDRFYGSNLPENIVAQLDRVNQRKIKEVEGLVANLKKAGNKVDYRVDVNYHPNSHRPTSFEPHIRVNGENYLLSKDLQKIYNSDVKLFGRIATNLGESANKLLVSDIHKEGMKNGKMAMALTGAMSLIDNTVQIVEGQKSVEEGIVDLTNDTGIAGVVAYGTGIITETVSKKMADSSRTLLKGLAKNNIPATAVSYAVESYDTISEFARGRIEGTELAYRMGDHTAATAGAIAGAKVGATLGTAVGPAGTVAGGVVGGMVGYVIASEAYQSAIEIGSPAVDALGEKVQEYGQQVAELATETIPEKAGALIEDMTKYASEFKLPLKL